MKKKWIIIGVAVLVVGLLAFNIWKSQTGDVVSVKTTVLETEEMSETVMTPGKLMLKDEQYVYVEPDKGEIADIFVEAGDTVKKGEKLLAYNNDQIELEKKQNQLQINGIYLELDQMKKEHTDLDKELDKDSDNEVLQGEHDQVKMQQQQKNLELEQALLEKESIEKRETDGVVKANTAGTVLSVDEKAGSQGQMAEQAVIRIGSLDDVVVTGAISEYDTLGIQLEQGVKLTSDAVPEKEWQGEVSYISDLPEELEVGQEETGATYPIEVKPEEDLDLKPGFKLLMEITTSNAKVDTLPLSAVQQEADDYYVFTVEDGKVKRTEVTIGTVNTEKMEVTKGLSKDDKVVVNPTDELKDGMEVKLK